MRIQPSNVPPNLPSPDPRLWPRCSLGQPALGLWGKCAVPQPRWLQHPTSPCFFWGLGLHFSICVHCFIAALSVPMDMWVRAPLLFYPAKTPATLMCSWILKTPRKTQRHTKKASFMDHGLSAVLLPSLTVIHLGQPLFPHVTNAEKDACFLPTLKLSCGAELCQVHLTSSAPGNFWKMITGYFKKKRTKKKSTCICASWTSALLLGSLKTLSFSYSFWIFRYNRMCTIFETLL